ncbi:hypothetical protein FQA39_LY02534 [Lamprigera yunnana]|nr:hypothetical protein FQA39_LY02534 [Lamprigera yunnana]
MVRSRTPSQGGGSQSYEMERKYSVPSNPEIRQFSGAASEDLHAWSIYRQNLNSDFTDSALGSTDKSPLPYGNFQLRDTTVQSILSHPRYGPKSALGSNMYTYLKFGLPRVFPPNQNSPNRAATPQHFNRGPSSRPRARPPKVGNRGPRDGSSGYDSSDNETTSQYKHNRKYRSDPDFRMQNLHPSYHHSHGGGSEVPLAALHQGGIKTNEWNKNKSNSEANLLGVDYGKYQNRRAFDPRRNSVAEFGPHLHQHDVTDHGTLSQIGRPMSKTESHLSVPPTRRRTSVVRPNCFSNDEEISPTFVYPHLQVCELGVWPRSNSCLNNNHHLLINNVSFEVRGGEIMGIMATSNEEGTALLNVLAGRETPAIGEIILNGQTISARILNSRVAYTQRNTDLCKHMTVLQTMRFHFDLKKPTGKLDHLKVDVMDRINVLIEDLGLEQVRNTKVSAMTVSETRRLNVACHLLLDTDIVLLDQPTKGMDIFDTFFLVEYLRQWANGGSGNCLGRIVILTLHPPTYEIFTMLSKVVLISAGRTMYSGKRKNMIPYFSMVDYPCPSFKNPSDYYLDLVTLDDLSAEAMLESSQRIEQLAELFRQKQEPMSDPGPPAALPMTTKNVNCFAQAFVLFTKAMFYTQPHTFIQWIFLIIMSASLSLIVGAIFWDVPNTDSQLNLNDRLGYHYTIMSVTMWPIILTLVVSEFRRNICAVNRDIQDNLYGKFTYIFVKVLINLFPSLFIWLIYLVPSYSMCGLYMQGPNNYDGFYIYLGLMLMYLCCIQIVITAVIYTLPFANTAAIVACTVVGAFSISTGYLLHFKDVAIYIKWLQYLSPSTWLFPYLIRRELTPEAISSSLATTLCRNKQVQHQDIIVQLPCPPPNGTQVLYNFGYYIKDTQFHHYDNIALALIIFYLICFVMSICAFIMNCNKNYKSKIWKQR